MARGASCFAAGIKNASSRLAAHPLAQKEPSPGARTDPLREPYICSYPPEDVRVEAYGDYLKKRGKSLLASERARVTPFVSVRRRHRPARDDP